MRSAIAPRSVSITVDHLRKMYGGATVLDDVCLDVRNGEFMTLLGPSGSGKTTLLMAIAGFVRPESGDLLFNGQSVVRKPPNEREIGMVFQNYALFPHMTVGKNIGYPLRLRKVGAAETRERVDYALDLVQLGGFASRRVDQLSGGQRQRVALARAIVFEPAILLMDEPLSALDKKLREQMQIEIRRLHDRLGVTTVYVTHDQHEALTLSDRIAVLHKGGIAQVDASHEIYERPTTRFIADFIGESHFLPVRLDAGRYFLGPSPLTVTLPPSAQSIARSGISMQTELLVVRPEMLTAITDEFQYSGPMNRFDGVVTNVLYQGDTTRYFVELDIGGTVSIRMTAAQIRRKGISVGSRMTLGLHPDDTVIVREDSGRG